MASGKRKTLRLTVAYDALSANVEGYELVDFVPVLRDPEPSLRSDAIWVKLESPGRRFARRLPDPAIGQEMFSPDGSVERVTPDARRTVVIDVPWWDDGAEVVIQGPRGPGEAAGLTVGPGPWREFTRFRPTADLALADQGAAPPPFPVTALFGTGNPKALKLIFLAEGFRAADLPAYRAVVDAFVAKLRVTAPFDAMMDSLAGLRMDSVSAQSGIDDPAAGVAVATWLDGRFGAGALRRLIEVDQARALAAGAAAAGKSSAFVAVVVVNTAEYGGSGGRVAVFSRDVRAADIALHELGHTLFGLADEYSDAGVAPTEPAEPNVTRKPDASTATWGPLDRQRLKWRQWLTPAIALPTTTNPNCSLPHDPPPVAGIGAFEGGKYRHCQVFRPARDCKMRTLSADFCPVCQATIRQKLAVFR